MAERIEPINLSPAGAAKEVTPSVGKSSHVFDEILGKAIDALNDVSKTEFTADKLVDDYIAGKVELSDVMIATAKMSVAVQFAVTAITSVVNTFKEITQIPI